MNEVPWRDICARGAEGYDAPPDDKHRVEACSGEGSAAYGEIPPESAARLLAWLAPSRDDVLFDLGCGTGKLCIQALCTSELGRAVGVELSRFRCDAALARRRELLEHAPELAARLEFVWGDFRNVDASAATLAYAGATAYPDELLLALAQNLSRAPDLRLLITTRPLPGSALGLFSERGRWRLPMSWAAHERVTVYEPR